MGSLTTEGYVGVMPRFDSASVGLQVRAPPIIEPTAKNSTVDASLRYQTRNRGLNRRSLVIADTDN